MGRDFQLAFPRGLATGYYGTGRVEQIYILTLFTGR